MRLDVRMLPIRRWFQAALLAGLVSCGCAACGPAVEPILPESTPPDAAPSASATVATTPLPTPTATPTSAATTPAPGSTPTGRPTVTATPTPNAPKHLAMARDGNILVGDLRGEDPTPIAQVELGEGWALRSDRLAMAQGGLVQMIDLVHGTHWETNLEAADAVVQVEVMWGQAGRNLLLTIITQQDDGPRTVLQAISGDTGASITAYTLPEETLATVLSFDDETNTAWVLVHSEKEELGELLVIPLEDPAAVRSYAIDGRSPVALQAETGQLAYLAPAGDSVCLRTIEQNDEQCAALPGGGLPTSLAWSADGQQLAVMLQPQSADDEVAAGDAGLWLFSIADGEFRQVIAHQGAMSSVLGWAPDDEMILARHSGGAIPDHVYLIRPDGGDRRILPGSERIVPLGWISLRATDAPEIELDTWLSSFASQAADAQTLADTTARWLAIIESQDDAELTQQLYRYVQASGVPMDLAGPQVWRIGDGIHLVQLPPLTIYVCDQGRAYPIASGHRIQDARLEGDLLAVIHATIGASSVNPDFVLAERGAQGWQVAWTPQGQRHWIATDGEIRFAEGSGDRLVVRGSSFTLEPAPGDPFRQCHACVHRWFEATWVRSANTYTLLGGGSGSDDEILWALTERTPYAVLHRALVRLRTDQSVDALVSSGAKGQIEALGLLKAQLVLVAEEETDESVIFADLDTGTEYRATVRQEQVVSVSRLGS